jgi:hypothetical protein
MFLIIWLADIKGCEGLRSSSSMQDLLISLPVFPLMALAVDILLPSIFSN